MAVNDDILNAQVSHSVYLQRYGAGVANRAVKLLKDTEKDLVYQIRDRAERIQLRGYDTGPATTERLQALLGAVTEMRQEAHQSMRSGLRDELTSFAGYEADFQRRLLESTVPVNVSFVRPSAEMLGSILTARPFQGRLLRQWMGDLEVADRKALHAMVRIGLVEGESIPAIVGRITQRLNITSRQATALARTAVNHVSNQARQQFAELNDDVVKAVVWRSTLDTRTSPICRARDNKQYPPNSGPRPPAHINCRSVISYVTKSFRELGIDRDEYPAGTRASMDGQVPADLSYGEWLRRQPRSVVLDTLGKRKGQLFLDGNLPIERFVDRKGAELTLVQLKKREAQAWKKAFDIPTEEIGLVDLDSAAGIVSERGLRDMREHAIAFDRAGNALIVKQGTSNSVGFNNSERSKILNGDNVTLVHNHPNGTTLSGADLIFSARHGLGRVVAVGTEEPSRFEAVTKAGWERISALHNMALIDVRSFLRKEVGAKRLTRKTADNLVYHVVNQALDAAGVIEYQALTRNQKLENALAEADTSRLNRYVRRLGAQLKS